jgi:type II secretory ATPase GspE/PulE/Tfp pilus assembly ATPase PilB-like protein
MFETKKGQTVMYKVHGEIKTGTPIIKRFSLILLECYRLKATSLVITPGEPYTVEYTTERILRPVNFPLPKVALAVMKHIVTRIKIMADLKISLKDVTQSGKIKIHLRKSGDRVVLVTITPTPAGEKATLDFVF